MNVAVSKDSMPAPDASQKANKAAELCELGNMLQIDIRSGLMALRLIADNEDGGWIEGGAVSDEIRQAVRWLTDHLLADLERLTEFADRESAA